MQGLKALFVFVFRGKPELSLEVKMNVFCFYHKNNNIGNYLFLLLHFRHLACALKLKLTKLVSSLN